MSWPDKLFGAGQVRKDDLLDECTAGFWRQRGTPDFT